MCSLDPCSQQDATKKRRVQRACDVCRRKKSDGVQGNPNPCSNCSLYGSRCTYVDNPRVRHHSPAHSYVDRLQDRLEKMEILLKKFFPGSDFSNELGGNDSWPMNQPSLPEHNDRTPEKVTLFSILAIGSSAAAHDIQDNSAFPPEDHPSDLAAKMALLNIAPSESRFFGKSSNVDFLDTVVHLNQEYTGRKDLFQYGFLHSRREQFWKVLPWEGNVVTPPPEYTFPSDDLLQQLLELYFLNVNVFFPLLHRPTFQAAIAAGLHHRDGDFGATVLLVCALGSRFSDDPRVRLDGVNSALSDGWKYFRQVQAPCISMLAPTSLYNLQFYVLSALFLQMTSAVHVCWTTIGIGVRLAQDVGAHRRTVFTSGSRLDNELWKRVFWCLLWIDRKLSAALGRPCTTQDGEFDLDFPIEVDDEYWDTSEEGAKRLWRQPEGKPSLITCFNCSLQLNQILAICLRTIYSINKSKIMLGCSGDWEQRVVTDLDSALNKWVDSVPDHLKWDPKKSEGSPFFAQSVFLYSHFYHLQILIHRPFIPSPRKPSPLSYRSLTICANAARSCIRLVDLYRQRRQVVFPPIVGDLFTAAVVLLFTIWGGKRSGLNIDISKEMEDVHKCMNCLKALENRYVHFPIFMGDVLFGLSSFGELPLPQGSPAPSNERDRDTDNPRSVDTAGPLMTNGETAIGGTEAPKAMAGVSGRVHYDMSSTPRQTTTTSTTSTTPQVVVDDHFFALPVHSDELGRLPLHGDITF
ncbi:hypothetical protein FISHEDRAFT_52319, partial [Fistulina hepatica ATCC 64428]